MSVWLLCALLFSLIGRTKQDGHLTTIKEVKVYAEETDTSEDGAWVLNVAWRDEFSENYVFKKISYEIEVFYTENMSRVHSETIHVMPNKTTFYHWKWTSPIPLQCTSHSVRLRHRDQLYVGEWTPLYTYNGQDLNPVEAMVYPRDQVFMIGSNITFCCIMETVSNVPYPPFGIQISNRTYITEPIHFYWHNESTTDIECVFKKGSSDASEGASVFIGYPPDDQNLTCITRDLSSVECHWERSTKKAQLIQRETKYKLNGRDCTFGQCGLPAMTKQVTKWTLVAKNPLGVKTLTDIADPTHRVKMRAPIQISHVAYARNVTLRWRWNEKNYASFPMICAVKLNGNFYKEHFSGKGLLALVLKNLQPFTKYTAQVRCGSNESFYEWGSWSEITEFTTKEDNPEAVDVWIQYFEQNAYVLWKSLTPQQSHGILTGYNITITNPKGGSQFDIILNTQLCYKINETNGQTITVQATNSAGLSPPSTIIAPSYPDNEVSISHINSSNGGFEISLEEYRCSTCGLVVEWFLTYNKSQCGVEWERIPKCDRGTWNKSDNLKPGERYTVSVYACSNDAPKLLKRSEGYAIEEKPGKVENLTGKNNGITIELSWNKVPLHLQKGFIQGYNVTTLLSGSEKIINNTVTKEHKVNLKLDPGSYIFRVSAFTSGGEGDYTMFKMEKENFDQVIAATIVGCSAAALVFIIITVLCYRKRKWLKKLLYPDIPEPKLAGKWITKGIYCTQMTEGYVKCDIQEAQSSEHPALSESLHGLDLISSNSKVPAHFYINFSESPVEVLYYPVEKLTSILENPSYNLTMPEPVDVPQISNLTLEMQDDYIPAPNFDQNNLVKDSESYKPQSTCTDEKLL
ncbi:leukemia inhibitory factor receptor-like isoform X1 [Carassius auratus]|uniref:Leukemia inhibitory factor receptor-like isoform X1 n=2 Tax=Carassius auratus TaxID=7957 RepID=A0A6P6M1Q4_CARAU|nr:leukemia inhibitory factor receptor-like isoform X1 [Carassius auratus]